MPTPTDQRFLPLLVPQRVDRIQARGFLGKIKSEKDPDGRVQVIIHQKNT